jgi:uncharacterized protein (TIGR00725 family)
VTVSRLPIVGVMGSGGDRHEPLARPVGELIARRGWHLLTGGGGGVMEAVAEAFCAVPDRRGLSIGVLRSRAWPELDEATGRRDYRANARNPWLEIAVATPLPASDQTFHSRNHVNVLTADALVVLPGGPGTLSELCLRLQYGGDAVLFLGEEGRVGGKTAEDLRADLAPPPGRLRRARSVEVLEAELLAQMDQLGR